MTVTDLHMTKRGRVAIYIDGTFWKSMHPDVFAASGLSVGMQIDETALETLAEQSNLKEAKEKALFLLSYKEYTARQLADRLAKDAGQQAAEQAVERMEELGLINDEDYAERYARELSERKLFGELRIRQEMRQRGLSEEQISFSLSLLQDDPDEKMQAILEKKYPAAMQDEKVRRRAYSALLRMGYTPSQARRALFTACRDEDGQID